MSDAPLTATQNAPVGGGPTAAPARGAASVEGRLFETPYRFDFFQAVRLLERLYPARPPVGREASATREVVRFHTHASLSFPPSAVQALARDEESGQAQMSVAFMGMTGPLGVLPRYYTEMALERTRKRERSLVDFLDLFDHRLISLFYRAWQKHRIALGYEAAHAGQESEDRFAHYLFDLFGLGTDGLRGRLQVADKALVFYAGVLAQRRRCSSALAGVLCDHFGVPHRVQQFRGRWLPLAEEQRTRLGGRDAANAVLGTSAVLGARFWDQHAAFRVQVGPLTLEQYGAFLPSGSAFEPLVQLTRFFVGQEFDFDVQLVLKAPEVPRCRLGGTGAPGAQLGWSSWLKVREFTEDAGDAIFGGELTHVGALPS